MPVSGIGGPCKHCGIRISCCWRRGPASKPVLCNACGSRYLVKKSLDGYIPIQQRAGGVVRSSPKPTKQTTKTNTLRGTPTARAGVQKPKRTATKKLDASTWLTESYDSEESDDIAFFANDSPVRSSTSGNSGQTAGPTVTRQPSLLGDSARSTAIVHITTQDQLSKLYSGAMAQLLAPSLRLKPRKPLNPTVSVVF